MLMVAPIGSTKRVTRLSMPRFSSRQRNVIGSVPALNVHQNKKLKFSHTRYQALGPELIPVYRQVT